MLGLKHYNMLEQEDYYIENGYYVFTEKYHLKRGYCCKSECRHCPWKYSKKNKESNIEEQKDENGNKI